MKRLNITWKDGISDTTGFLHSYIKSVGTAVKNSPYSDIAEEIVATSGFAFRMWVEKEHLSPSAMSSWDFECQREWIENSGLNCCYIGRAIEQVAIEEAKRLEAIKAIKESLDQNIAVICWDICGAEWGLITGYDEENKTFHTLSITGFEEDIAYDLLGRGDIPELSVLTITGRKEKGKEEILKDTIRLAVSHLKGEEAGKDTSGIMVYEELLRFLGEDYDFLITWNIEFYLGSYAALKEYAYQYFKNNSLLELSKLYNTIRIHWKQAFDLSRSTDIIEEEIRNKLKKHIATAFEAEKKALSIMENIM